MSQPITVKFNEKNKRSKKRDGQFPIECLIQEIGPTTGKRLTKRRAFYGGKEVANRDIPMLSPGENRFISLSEQNISNLDFSNAELQNADLTGAVCRFTDFTDANMDGANIEGADLTGALISSDQLRKTTGKPYAYPYGRGVTATKMAALRKTNRLSGPSPS